MNNGVKLAAVEDEGGILFQSQAEEAVNHIQPLLASERISLFTGTSAFTTDGLSNGLKREERLKGRARGEGGAKT